LDQESVVEGVMLARHEAVSTLARGNKKKNVFELVVQK
jgi:hypothetical protein